MEEARQEKLGTLFRVICVLFVRSSTGADVLVNAQSHGLGSNEVNALSSVQRLRKSWLSALYDSAKEVVDNGVALPGVGSLRLPGRIRPADGGPGPIEEMPSSPSSSMSDDASLEEFSN